MPGRGRCGSENRKRCRRRSIYGFLEPCLLLLLHGKESHGYQLLEDLEKFGFHEVPADSSTIYRMLRSLEERNLVESRWNEGDAGPARRVYSLTDEGNLYLKSWVEELKKTRHILQTFLKKYRRHMEIFHGEND